MLVDLPGYGYAAAPKREIARWTRLIEHYLKGRAGLRRVLLLIDARHGIKAADRRPMTLLDEAAVSYPGGADQVRQGRSRRRWRGSRPSTAAELAKHPAAHPALYLTSAHDGDGHRRAARRARRAGGGAAQRALDCAAP